MMKGSLFKSTVVAAGTCHVYAQSVPYQSVMSLSVKQWIVKDAAAADSLCFVGLHNAPVVKV
jgi:hypothetical protein